MKFLKALAAVAAGVLMAVLCTAATLGAFFSIGALDLWH